MHKPSPQQQKTQNLLLIAKLLDFRDNVSPFTLVLDSLEQSARPLLREVIRRSKSTRISTIFVSFESIKPPEHVDHFIKAYALSPKAVQFEIKAISTSSSNAKHLIIIDTLHGLLRTTSNPSTYLTSLLSPAAPSPNSPLPSLLAIYHTDIPLPTHQHYHPPQLTLLAYVATAVLTLHAPHHVLARRAASYRSVAAPVFGLAEASMDPSREDAVLQGLGANASGAVVVEAEVRRRSGREAGVWFVLDWRPNGAARAQFGSGPRTGEAAITDRAEVFLFADHPLFSRPDDADAAGAAGSTTDQEGGIGDVTFNLGLTEKQRRDREGVVLPYFDAQRDGGDVGPGGRILYDMGVEDDFDEEEDEI